MEQEGIPEYDLTERRAGNITTEIMALIARSFTDTSKIKPVTHQRFLDSKVITTKGLIYALDTEQVASIRPQLGLLGYVNATNVKLEVELDEMDKHSIKSLVRIEDDQVRATFLVIHNERAKSYEVLHRVLAREEIDKPPLIFSEEQFDPARAIEILAVMRGMIEANKAGAESVSYDELGYIDDLVRAL